MFSFKIRLLIALLTFSFGILFIWFRLCPEPTETPLDAPLQPANRTAKVDSRFEKAVRDEKLQAEADALLPLFDRMPPVPIYLKDAPILESGTNTETGNAYTFCDGNEVPLIFVKKIYYQKANRKRFTNTLKHELTHAWLCRQHLISVGHGELFQRKFRAIGGWGSMLK